MAKTSSMTRNQNHDDDASSRKRFKTYDYGGVAPWSELKRDVLFEVMMQLGVVDFVAFSGVCKSWRSIAISNRNRFMASVPAMSTPWLVLNQYIVLLIMMQLGVVDFIAFSGVCKSWRSLALSNKNKFMASRLPMQIRISNRFLMKECYLEDFEGRKFKTYLPDYDVRSCVGLTCGYLIFYGGITHDFWLVNPITRNELHFPCVPFHAHFFENRVKAILVFSPSISGWVFVVAPSFTDNIWFSVAGKGAWNHVSSNFQIIDIHAFKGKIYTLNSRWRVCELKFNPEPKLTLLKIKKFPMPHVVMPELVSSDENLYVIDIVFGNLDIIFKLDFGEMKWVLPEENTLGEYAFLFSILKNGAAMNGASVKLDSLVADPRTAQNSGKGRFFATRSMWYFPHECMNVHRIND